MGFIKKQLLSVIEWNEDRDDILFWKWPQSEIKKSWSSAPDRMQSLSITE